MPPTAVGLGERVKAPFVFEASPVALRNEEGEDSEL